MSSARGFTLIEVGVVIFVMAALVGVAIPTLRSVTGVEAQGAVGKLASNIRASRGKAAVSGETCRLEFDLDDGSYELQCAQGFVRARAERSRGGERIEQDEERDLKRLTEQERAEREILKTASFAPSPSLPRQKLPGKLDFRAVWTAHQEEKYVKGKAYLYFYPSGMSERANVQLEDGDRAWSLHVSSLAAKVRVHADLVELPGQQEESY